MRTPLAKPGASTVPRAGRCISTDQPPQKGRSFLRWLRSSQQTAAVYIEHRAGDKAVGH